MDVAVAPLSYRNVNFLAIGEDKRNFYRASRILDQLTTVSECVQVSTRGIEKLGRTQAERYRHRVAPSACESNGLEHSNCKMDYLS
jgi:hypothetical protein